MPDNACLHLQRHPSDPIRVVELRGVVARIGRAVFCDVRLADPDIAEEACRLRLRGGSWHLIPVGTTRDVEIDGLPLTTQHPLAIDASFRVGGFLITLRTRPALAPVDIESAYETSSAVEATLAAAASARASSRIRLDRAETPSAAPIGTRVRTESTVSATATATATRLLERPRGAIRAHAPVAPRPDLPARPARPPRPAAPEIPRLSTTPSRSEARPSETTLDDPRHRDQHRRDLAARLRALAGLAAKKVDDRVPTTREPIAPAALKPAPTRSRTPYRVEPHAPVALATQPTLDEPEPEPEPTIITAVEPAIVETPVEVEVASVIEPAIVETPVEVEETRAAVIEEVVHTQIAVPAESPAESPAEAPPLREEPPASAASSFDDWPSARSILEARRGLVEPGPARRARPGGTRTADRDKVNVAVDAPAQRRRESAAKGASLPRPTVPHAPASRRVPAIIAVFWSACVLAALGLVVGLTTIWALDARTSGVLMNAVASKTRLPRSVASKLDPPERDVPWWRTSAPSRLAWALYLDRDPAEVDEARAQLDAALRIAPLDPAARFNLVRRSETKAGTIPLVASLGLSRDVVTLTAAAGRLLAAGKLEAARRAYREAIDIALTARPRTLPAPAYIEDSQIRRYALPLEDLVAIVVDDIARRSEWTYDDWSKIIPRRPIAQLVVARVLRSQSRPEADIALDAAVAPADPAINPTSEPFLDALDLAARGEALALKGRIRAAADLYRQAIDRVEIGRIRRVWSFNLADLALRLDDERGRNEALRAALSGDMRDEVTRRVADLIRARAAAANSRYASRADVPNPETR